MTVSKRETALAAAFAKIDAIDGANAVRNADVPEEVPDGGLIIFRNGDPGDPDTTLGAVKSWYWQHAATIEVYAADQTALDALLQKLDDAFPEGETLGGAVDRAWLSGPEFVDATETGLPTVSAAQVTLTLEYETDSPLG